MQPAAQSLLARLGGWTPVLPREHAEIATAALPIAALKQPLAIQLDTLACSLHASTCVVTMCHTGESMAPG